MQWKKVACDMLPKSKATNLCQWALYCKGFKIHLFKKLVLNIELILINTR